MIFIFHTNLSHETMIENPLGYLKIQNDTPKQNRLISYKIIINNIVLKYFINTYWKYIMIIFTVEKCHMYIKHLNFSSPLTPLPIYVF